MANQDTAQKDSTATVASPNASEASSITGSESKQPVNSQAGNGQVESKETEVKGNSAASDGQDGADSEDGVRNRPGRAERKISELTKQIKELESKLAQDNSLAEKLQSTPVDSSAVTLPDYSQMTEVTPDQLKKDIINAASQIVDLKMQTTATALEQKLTMKEASEKSATAIEAAIGMYDVLNPDSEDYDQALDTELSDSYAEVLRKDPSYSFAKFIKPMERFLKEANTTETTKPRRGTSANRTTGSSKSQKPFDEMSTAEMEAWFASKRSR